MQYLHSPDKSQKYANAAFAQITQKGFLPTPETYELWYVYYSGENPEVNNAIDVLTKSNEKMTDEHCHGIYNQFLGHANESERVKQAGDRVQMTIKEVNGMVGNVKTATSQYNVSLENVSSKLASNISIDDMKGVVTDMKSKTRTMIEYNTKLEEELGRSAVIMRDLQRDLDLVRKEAMTDGLTKLSNRKAFDVEIRRILEESTQIGYPFSVLLLDIDHFKSFNDNYGHMVGDQVLRLVARTLVDGVKGRDMAARYGGEEFAIILPETNIQGAFHVADKLRKDVEKKEVVNKGSGQKLGRITISGGVAQHASGEDIDSLIERADAALYASKRAGRNQISIASESVKKR